ncbi:restriction endonuclease subunit S [Psychrobacter sp. R86515]|uniref:restriction endonuclease subunit S n=1 Tax=Psychrobacter sp. R86515 TaxID=3093855 RepID=UPI0036D2B085
MVSDLLETFELESRCLIKSSSRIFAKEYVEDGVPFFRSKDVIDKALGVFSGYDLFISRERYEELKKSHGSPSKGDLLISSVGNRSGQPYVVQDEGDFYFKDGNIIWISNFKDIDSNFLAYWFKSNIGQSRLASVMIGSAQKALTINSIRTLTVTFPIFANQKAIAHILGSLDDKIELNRQMNETLEAMAQALFKSWFVDFDPVIDNALASGNTIPDELLERAEQRKAIKKKDNSDIQELFPDEFEFTEEMGWIPKGWAVSEVGKILNRLKTQVKYKKDDVSDYGKVPVYEQGSGILLGFHNNEPDIKASNEDPAFIFGDHTCVTKLSLESFSISANVIPLRGKDYPTIWVYYAVQDKQSFEEYRRHWMEFIIKPVISPSLKLTEIFSKYVESFGAKQMQIQYQNSDLAKLRDTLLPKLMSGELRIPDAVDLIEKV